MKKIIHFVVALGFNLFLTVPALAQIPTTIQPAPRPIAGGPTYFIVLLGYIVQYMWTLFLIIAVIFYLWAAFMYLEARGDEEKIRKARGALIWGVVAMAVAILAFSVRTIVYNLLLVGTWWGGGGIDGGGGGGGGGGVRLLQ